VPLQYETIVEMKGITKVFPGVKALTDVDLEIKAGEVHALVGENGAGKSTIIKILMGVYPRTSGEIYLEGKKVDIKSPLQAQALGLGAVYQDVNLAQHLSVAENFFMGQLPKTRLGLIDYAKIYRETKEIMDSIEVHVDPKAILSTLSVAQQEMVAIGKILHQKAKLVIFDEPTALLTNDETEQLFKIISMLKQKNVAIIYISHRMEEIFRICDRATVLKDGAKAGTVYTKDTSEDELISMMVGRDVEDMYGIAHAAPGKTVVSVKGLTRSPAFRNISFDVRQGEIFGMFGLVGSGRTEIVRSIFGADAKESGTVEIGGRPVDFRSPRQAIDAGVALLPEERKTQGLALGLSIMENTNMAAIKKISRYGVINNRKGVEVAEKFRDILHTKTPTVHQLVKNLSGGNQQKVVIAKWLAMGSDLFIFDEPTVGVDVGAKMEIYRVFEQLIRDGKTIIIISSYLPEVMGLADRLLIMYEGRQMAILDRADYQEETILKLASGIKQEEPA
jgi:ribose transport system ATP-binding protein